MSRKVETVSSLYDYLHKFEKEKEKLEKMIDSSDEWTGEYDEWHRRVVRDIKYIKGTIMAIEKKGN